MGTATAAGPLPPGTTPRRRQATSSGQPQFVEIPATPPSAKAVTAPTRHRRCRRRPRRSPRMPRRSPSTLAVSGLDLTDAATLAGGFSPTGTITFKLFTDASGACGSQVGSSVTATVNSGNNTYTSPSVHVSSTGLYHWVASYGGDSNNNAVSGACGDSNENVTVHQGEPDDLDERGAPLDHDRLRRPRSHGHGDAGRRRESDRDDHLQALQRQQRQLRDTGRELRHDIRERERRLHVAVGSHLDRGYLTTGSRATAATAPTTRSRVPAAIRTRT